MYTEALSVIRLVSAIVIQSNKQLKTHLIECIIETLVQVLQVQQDHCLTSFHAHLDTIDISTHLKINNISLLFFGNFAIMALSKHVEYNVPLDTSGTTIWHHLLLYYYVICARYHFKWIYSICDTHLYFNSFMIYRQKWSYSNSEILSKY